MTKNIVEAVVFVRDREVTYVGGVDDFRVLYMNDLEGGACPRCGCGLREHEGSTPALTSAYCKDCRFDWAGASTDAIVRLCVMKKGK